MKIVIGFVFCLCASSLAPSEAYRAATIITSNGITPNAYASLINRAANANVDILVLPVPELSDGEYSYDEVIKTVSKATKQAGLYVVAHVFDKAHCKNKMETIRSNLVFDRKGSVISVYRKPLNNVAKCTAIDGDLVTFPTDFGVKFGVLMEEDIVLRDVEYFKGLKNFVMTGAVATDIQSLTAVQFLPSWLHVIKANLVSSAGIYGGMSILDNVADNLVIADFDADNGLDYPPAVLVTNPLKSNSYPSEDLTHYSIIPLDVERSAQGYQKTVCHRSFCCDFHIKTSVTDSKSSDVSYGLGAFEGIRHYSEIYNIGTQNCGVFACAGLYKRSCGIGSENNSTNISFEKITISANFTMLDSAQYPIVQSADILSIDSFKFDSKIDRRSKKMIAEINNTQNLLTFGIFGRDFTKDYVTEFISTQRNNTQGLTDDIHEFFLSEGVQEFFDYVWIRLRILIFVVSIYFLEMM